MVRCQCAVDSRPGHFVASCGPPLRRRLRRVAFGSSDSWWYRRSGCSASPIPASEIEIATSPKGKTTSKNTAIAHARYFRKRLPRGSKRSRADISGPYATVMVQPGDSCGTNPPAWAYGQACIGFSYDGLGIDPSCGNIEWNVDSSGLPTGATMAFAPSETAIGDTVAIAVFASASAATGTYTFRVGATCSNANSTGSRPGTGEWTLAIISTDIVDQTQSSPATITLPGKLEDQVGAEESLKAKVTPSDAEPYMSNYSWSIPYSTDVQLTAYVDSYLQSNDSATVTSVTTTNNPLHFFPIAAYSGGSQLTFSASSGAAGTAFHGATNYVIHAPTLSVDVSTHTVNVGTIPANLLHPIPVLIAGWTNENQDSGDGIVWSATFTSTSSFVHGQAGMTPTRRSEHIDDRRPQEVHRRLRFIKGPTATTIWTPEFNSVKSS